MTKNPHRRSIHTNCGWTPREQPRVTVDDQYVDVMRVGMHQENVEAGFGTVSLNQNLHRRLRGTFAEFLENLLKATANTENPLQVVYESFNLYRAPAARSVTKTEDLPASKSRPFGGVKLSIESTLPTDQVLDMNDRLPVFTLLDTADQESGLSINTSHDDRHAMNIGFWGRDPAKLQAICAWVLEFSDPLPPPIGRIHMMVVEDDSLEFKPLPMIVGCTLKPENYNRDVLLGYRRVADDLQSVTPRGRIAIFNGKPGTGKTYLLRSLLHELGSKSKFVYVAPGDVIKLTSPSTLPALLHFKGETNLPITLLIEDADEILAPREGDNMSHVSALLNLGDGLLGQALDLRMILTTNAHEQRFDKAIIRPGRLSANVSVGSLDLNRARELIIKLRDEAGLTSGDPDAILATHGPMTLAEVYQHALDPEFVPSKERQAMGY